MLTILASASLALASAQPPATAPASVEEGPQVSVGRFDPAAFPEARLRERRLPIEAMLGRIESIMREGRCAFAGQTLRRFDIRVPYVVKLAPDGRVLEIVVTDMGCVPLEFYVGSVVRELARVGDFRPTRAPGPRWFAEELRFTVQ